MTRGEAEELVKPYIKIVGPYQAIMHEDARQLLGDERFERLLKDKIRNQGPTVATVYPWNVIDYLSGL